LILVFPEEERFAGIQIDYALEDPRLNDDLNVTLFESDCVTPLNDSGLSCRYRVNSRLVALKVLCDQLNIEDSPIWNPTYNDGGAEIGGNFSFCVRAAVIDEVSTYEMDFEETKFTARVDKTTGAGFNLDVEIDRDEVGEEDAGGIDYSGSVRGFQCDVNTFVESDDAVEQGESLGLCVESKTDGIEVVGWQKLTLSRDGFEFDAIEDGVIPTGLTNLVDSECNSALGQCISEVELVALFFNTDGSLTVDGTVVVGIKSSGARRHLVKVQTEITRETNELDISRILDDKDGEDENEAEGSFGIKVSLVSGPTSASGSAHFGPSLLLAIIIATVILVHV
jgi:hypothetical protein